MSESAQYLLVIGVYMVGMLLVGFYFQKRAAKSDTDFYAAGRALGPMVVGFSYTATQISASTYMGAFGTSSLLGYNHITSAVASAAAAWCTFLIIGTRMKKIGDRIGGCTIGDIMETRYDRVARLISAVIIVVAYVPFLVGQLKGSATTVEVLFGIPYWAGILIMGVIVLLYTAAGGAYAVCWTDLFQGLIMIVGMLILAPIATKAVGGFTSMNEQFQAINPALTDLTGLKSAMWVSCNIITWSILQIGGAPSALVRFYMAKDNKTLKKSLAYSIAFATAIYFARGFISPAGRILYNLKNADALIPTMAHNLLPPVVGGLIIAAAIAAMMSSVDSVLLLVTSSFCRDILDKGLGKTMPDQRAAAKRAQWFTLVFGAITVLLALKPPAAILWLTTFTFSILASAFTAPLVAAFWWKDATKLAARWAMIIGAAVCAFWYGLGWRYYHSWSDWPFGIWPGIVGAAISTVVLVIVSKMTPKPDKSVVETYYVA